MTRGALLVGAMLAVGIADGLTAQSVTGPAVDGKGSAQSAADATVAKLVYDPIKLIGMRGFTPEGRIELKAAMDRAEAGVRGVMADLSAGRLDEPGARIALAHVLRDYRSEVRRLRRPR